MPGDDPPTPAPEPKAGGIIYIPAHGLQLEGDSLRCHGLHFLRVDGETWSKLEALWMRDQELDIWLNRERIFAAMPYEGDVRGRGDPGFNAAYSAYDTIVTAARLVAPGVWINPEHIAAVARGNDGTNVRIVGSGRPRMWAAVFGEPLKVRGRRREWGERIECRPLQYHLPHGPAYRFDAERAQIVERSIAVLAALRELAPHHGWWVAHRAFQRGHDLFVPRRLRLAALFGAFEALFGPFRRDKKKNDPGVGVAVATLLERSGWEAQDPAGYVEKALRQARNRLAHGSDLGVSIDFASVEENLIDILRAGLGFCSAWIRGVQQPDGPLAPGSARTLTEFQRWLGRIVSEDD